MIKIPKDSEIQIEEKYQVKMVGIEGTPFITNLNLKTNDGWILEKNHILMIRKVYRHQIDTPNGIYVGIFGERLNLVVENNIFLNLERLKNKTPREILKINDWTFENINI